MKNPTLWASFRAAMAGLLQSAAAGRNMRFHWLAGYTVLLIGFWLDLPAVEMLILFLVVSQVLAAEMINTAVETVTDLATGRFHPLAKKAKDIAAGAVLVSSLASVSVALFIFLPRIGSLPGVLGARLAHPDAVTVLEVSGFVAMLVYWAVSLTPGWARQHMGRADATRDGARGTGHGEGAVRRHDGGGGDRQARRRTQLGGGNK